MAFGGWSRLFDFQFMKHDAWSDVLFLHWKVPTHLESVLEDSIGPFRLDRYQGSAYIGLVFLTEQGVGPYLFSDDHDEWRRRLSVTHHGLNVRTYVDPVGLGVDGGEDGNDDDNNNNELGPGICFASLECNSIVASLGARMFGMPYCISRMQRTREQQQTTTPPTTTTTTTTATTSAAKTQKEVFHLSCQRVGFWHCLIDWIRSWCFFWIRPKMTSIIDRTSNSFFSVDCTWTVAEEEVSPQSTTTTTTISTTTTTTTKSSGAIAKSKQRENDNKDSLSNFLVERYHVYTKKYGCTWKGTVHHEPWPIKSGGVGTVELQSLKFTNLKQYQPSSLHPLLEYVASHPPDSVIYSQGVGPVTFDMLRPVRVGSLLGRSREKEETKKHK